MQTIKILADELGGHFEHMEYQWSNTPQIVKDAIAEVIFNRHEVAKTLKYPLDNNSPIEAVVLLNEWAKEPPTDTRIKLENLLEDYCVPEDVYNKLEELIDA